jgi:transcriptional regulator with XRE-family HTH domain
MNNYNFEIGQRIAALRRKQHITQETFAEFMNISVKHCSAVERGVSAFSLEKLMKAADFFNCSMDYLLRGFNSSDVSGQLPYTILEIIRSDDEKEKALLNEYLQMYTRLRQGEKKDS